MRDYPISKYKCNQCWLLLANCKLFNSVPKIYVQVLLEIYIKSVYSFQSICLYQNNYIFYLFLGNFLAQQKRQWESKV